MDWQALFPSQSIEDWQQRLQKDLHGGAWESLNRAIGSEIIYFPAVHAEEQTVAQPPVLNRGTNWQTAEYFDLSGSAQTVNLAILEALSMGLDGLTLLVPRDFADWEVVLHDVLFELIHINLVFEEFTATQLTGFRDWFSKKAQNCDNASVALSSRQNSPLPVDLLEELFAHCAQVRWAVVGALDVSGKPDAALDAATASIRQLATILKQGVAHDRVGIRVVLGTHYFLSIAILRAWSILFNNLLAQAGHTPRAPFLDVHFALDAQNEDEHSQKIAATTQVLSAVVGNAACLTVLPSDATELGSGSDFNRRIARNNAHLLRLESHLDKVADPAAGSYFLEKLTDQVAEHLWAKAAIHS